MVHRPEVHPQEEATLLVSRLEPSRREESDSHFSHENVEPQHRDWPKGAYIGRSIWNKVDGLITGTATVLRCDGVICIAPSESRFESTGHATHYQPSQSNDNDIPVSLSITVADDPTGMYFVTDEKSVPDSAMADIEGLVGKDGVEKFAWTEGQMSWMEREVS